MRVLLALTTVITMAGTGAAFSQQSVNVQREAMTECNSEMTAAHQQTRDTRKAYLADCLVQKTRSIRSSAEAYKQAPSAPKAATVGTAPNTPNE